MNPIIRVFPRRTKWTPDDPLSFVGEMPFFHPGTPETPVMVSVTFTWDRKRAEQIAESWRTYYRNISIGGPAYDDPAGEFTPGMFLKEGCTITTRGCPKKCGFCKVWRTEGALRTLTIHPGWIVQDNNLLASPEPHIRTVFEMLQSQNRHIYFNGGLDKHFLKPWHRELFESIPIGELWFACDPEEADPDAKQSLRYLARVREILPNVPTRRLRCYTMVGYGEETLAAAERRIERVFDLGFMPFSQLYQPPTAHEPTKVYSDDWKKLNRKWCRPAAYMSDHPITRSPDLPMFEEAKTA